MSNVKRPLADVGGVGPEFSPHLKHARIDNMAQFIMGRFRVRDGMATDKSRVLEVVLKEYDSTATAPIVGQAMTKAFGSHLYDKRRKNKNKTSYANIQEYDTSSVAQATAAASIATADPPAAVHPSADPSPAAADPSPAAADPSPAAADPSPAAADPAAADPAAADPSPAAPATYTPRSTHSRSTSKIPIRSATYIPATAAAPSKSPSKIPRLTTRHIPSLSTVEGELLDMLKRAEAPYTKPILVSEAEARFVDRMRFRAAPYNVAQLVSTAEAVVLKAMRENQANVLQQMLKYKVYKRLERSIVEYCTNVIKREILFYTRSSLCLLKKSSAADMESFSLKRLWEEFQIDLPTLTEVIVGACTRDDDKKMKIKTVKSMTPAITTIIAKCLGTYSRKLSAMRTFYSIVLSQGGVTASAMNRLAKLYDCTTYQSLLPKLNTIAEGYQDDLNEWLLQQKEFAIVFDNVDVYLKPRMESKSKTNTMSHMVQAIAVQERVEVADKGEPKIYIDDIKAADLVPTAADMKSLRTLMVEEVVRVWSSLPGLKGVKLQMKEETHRYSNAMKKKSQLVNLGVKKKNENIKEELLVCLKEYHNLVPERGDSLEHKLCIGDYLSFERGQMVISSQSDGKTATDRLEGLVMGIADFHVQMNFLKMGYKVLFSGESQPSVGSLAHAKDYLNAKNVVADPCKNYYGCGALYDKVYTAYLNNAALQGLSMTSLETDCSDTDSESVREAAEQTVTKFVDMTFPDLNDTGKIRCTHCSRKYSSRKNLQKHHIKEHPDQPMVVEEKDSVFTYSCAVITIGLIRAIHNRAIQLGNGDIVILLYKFMYLLFKANGSFKYGCGILETIIQSYVLPTDLSTRLIWNRFFNAYNKPDTNIPLDLQLEHENRMFKELLKTYRGQFTQAHLDRISKGRHRIDNMIQALDKELGYHGSQAGKRPGLAEGDVKALTELYAKANLLNREGIRAHSPALTNITRNLAGGVNGKSMREWLTERIELCRIRNYYRQFSKSRFQPGGDNMSSSLDPMPESDENVQDASIEEASIVY